TQNTMKTVSPKNSVQIIGRLGGDPDIKTFPSTFKKGKDDAPKDGKLARFSVATHEPYRNSEGAWVERTEWHNIVCWDAQAETAERMLQKGSEVLVTGRLHYNTYTKDGITRTTAEIEAAGLIVMDK